VPRFQYYNLNNARIDGVEFQSRMRLGRVGFALNAGFPRGIDTQTGNHILDVGPPRVTADFTVPTGRLLPMGQLAARVRWTDAVEPEKAQDVLLARQAVWVASFEVSSVLAGVRTVLAVRNLFDQFYYEPLSFIPESGRTFALSLRKDFSIPLGLGRKGS